MKEMVDVIWNSRLISFIHWYQNFWAGLRMISLVRRVCWGTIMTASSVAPASLIAAAGIVTAGMLHTRRRKYCTPSDISLCHWMYLSEESESSSRPSSVAGIRPPPLYYRSRLPCSKHSGFVAFLPLQRVLLNLVFHKPGRWNLKDQNVTRTSGHVIYRLRFG